MHVKGNKIAFSLLLALFLIYLGYRFIENSFVEPMPHFYTSIEESKQNNAFITSFQLQNKNNKECFLSFQPWVERAWFEKRSILGFMTTAFRKDEYNLLYPYYVYMNSEKYDLRYRDSTLRAAGSRSTQVQLSSVRTLPDKIKLFVELKGSVIDTLYFTTSKGM